MRTRTAAALIGLAVLGAAVERAMAQDGGAAFDRLDLDGSGEIAWAEAYEVRSREFMQMDRNMDGIVTGDEFRGPARSLSAFDHDGDRELHLAEFLQGHRSMFQRFDDDANGALNAREFMAAQSAARGDRGPAGTPATEPRTKDVR